MAEKAEKNVREGRSKDTPRGWYSRRHETDEANRKAREVYESKHDKAARRERAKARNEARARRSPEEQLALVFERIKKAGGDPNKSKEVRRLEKQIEFKKNGD